MSKKMTRIVVAVLLLVTCMAGAAQAAPWSLDGPEPSPVASLWDWIASWLSGETTDEGPHMDPDGSTVDEGPHMDPNG